MGWGWEGGAGLVQRILFPERNIYYWTQKNQKKKVFCNQVEEVKKDTSSKEFLKINDNICEIELGSDLIFTLILILAPNGT